MSFYLGDKRTASNTTGRTSQSKKAKQQLVRAPVHDENEPDISNDESGDNKDNQDEPYLEGKISSDPLPNRLLSQRF